MREAGYYWVRDDEGWCVACFYHAGGYAGWRATNCETDFYDDDWYEIDERRIERGSEQQRDELVAALDGCQRELAYMIEKHNVQNMEDGSWLYDYQTPCEAQQLIHKAKAAQAGE